MAKQYPRGARGAYKGAGMHTVGPGRYKELGITGTGGKQSSWSGPWALGPCPACGGIQDLQDYGTDQILRPTYKCNSCNHLFHTTDKMKIWSEADQQYLFPTVQYGRCWNCSGPDRRSRALEVAGSTAKCRHCKTSFTLKHDLNT
jgi:hypothetical protein